MVSKHLVAKVENTNVVISKMDPTAPLARRASSHLILETAKETASTLKPPPQFSHSIMFMDQFSSKHSGAKSNNLKNLRNKLDKNVKLPESACIPFQMAEYAIGLEPGIKKQLENLIEKV